MEILVVDEFPVSASVLISAILKKPESERNLIFIKHLNFDDISEIYVPPKDEDNDESDLSSNMKLLSLLRNVINSKYKK
jgi:hypothetical protein